VAVTTKVERQVVVSVPVRTAYNQWTQFEEFPRFMSGVERVEQLTDDRVHWVAEIAGVKREWDATILEQVPDRKVAWAATEGATNAGAVYFEDRGGQTEVRLVLEFEPEGLVERAGDALGIVERQAALDLERFKSYIESRSTESGGWRGSVDAGAGLGTPDASWAEESRGDGGKAGISAKGAAAGAVAAAAGAAAAGAGMLSRSGGSDDDLGDQDVIAVLTTDHREFTDLIEQIRTTTDPETRRDLADMLITDLVRHAVAEEMYIYPAMKEHLPDGEAAVEHDTEEHKDIERTLKQLESIDPSDAKFMDAIGHLSTVLDDHIQDEEEDQFPQLRTHIPPEKMSELARKVHTAKKLAPTRPHPMAPNAAPFHKLVGPGVGLVDRVRDKLSGRTTG
jgi:hemerythrin superfamily protein